MSVMTNDEVLAYLKQHGHKIGEEARRGNPAAIAIVDAYEFCHKSPDDPGGRAMLAIKVGAWKITH